LADVSAGVFISYRREETAGHVGRLYDALSASLGADRVFMDIDHVEPGEDFVDVLNRAVAGCRVLLVVIGPRWLTVPGPQGTRRLDDPNDFVRLEVAAGLSRSVRVIPILVHGATMPSPSELPPELAGLARRQAIELSDQRWKQDVEALINSLRRHQVPASKRPSVTKMAIGAAAIAAVAITIIAWRLSKPASVASDAGRLPTRDTGVLVDDDFVSQRRLTGSQTRGHAGGDYCLTSYVEEGFLIEAVNNSEACEYVLYERPYMPNRARVELSMKLERASPDATSVYGIRFMEAQPPDPDSPMTYHATISGVDSFYVVEQLRDSTRTLINPNPAAENYIRAGERQTNEWRVDVAERSMEWSLNDVAVGTTTARAALSGGVSVYLRGRGLKIVVSHLQISAGAP
jgi:hypothetical protein